MKLTLHPRKAKGKRFPHDESSALLPSKSSANSTSIDSFSSYLTVFFLGFVSLFPLKPLKPFSLFLQWLKIMVKPTTNTSTLCFTFRPKLQMKKSEGRIANGPKFIILINTNLLKYSTILLSLSFTDSFLLVQFHSDSNLVLYFVIWRIFLSLCH